MTATRFQAGLLVDEGAFYVRRDADERLYERLSAMEFSAVLAPRQVGKSSLCHRVADRLAADGVRVVTIEDATVGTASVAPEEQERKWYYGIGSRIAEQLDVTEAFRKTWNEDDERVPLERFRVFLERDVCVEGVRTVIFLDEIDRVRSVKVNLDAFFDLLREIVNARARDERWRRIAFCLAGVATVDELARDRGRVALAIPGMLVRLDDLTLAQMDEFAPGLEALPGGAKRWVDAIHGWTQGHPALTQALGKALTENAPSTDDAEGEVRERVRELFLARGRAEHPIFRDTDRRFGSVVETGTDARLPRILALYERVLDAKRVAVDENDPNQLALRVGGLVRFGDDGQLVLRNRIFATLFDTAWVKERMGARPFAERVHHWNVARDASDLPSGSELVRAEDWARTREDLTVEERAFLDAARAQRSRTARWRQVALGMGFLAAVQLMAVFYEQSQRARHAEDAAKAAQHEAHHQRDLATRREREARLGLFVSQASELRLLGELPGFEYEDLADALVLDREVTPRLQADAPGVAGALFQTASATVERMPLQGHTGSVSSAAFSPDGQRVVTASDDHTARVWNALDGRFLATLQGHTSTITSAAFSPDGQRVVTASADYTARVWNAQDGTLLATLQGHTGSVSSAAFSPDGQRVVTASWDHTARVWNAQDGTLLATLQGHSYGVESATFSPDGQRVVTASADYTARVWNAQDGTLLATLQGHSNDVKSAAFSPDGQRIVTASADHMARVWNAQDGRLLTTLQGHTNYVESAAFSPDGQRVVTASLDNTARVWNAQDGGLLANLQGHTDLVTSAAFSPDGERVVTASADNTARVWNAQDGRLLATLQGHTGYVGSAAFSPDGLRVATASSDNTARVWSTQDGRLLATLHVHATEVTSVAFSPDSQRVVTASPDDTARVWTAQDGRLLATLQGHTSRVTSAAFSPDGQRVVTASWDATARVWSAQDGRLLATLQGHAFEVTSAAFSPDGQRVFTASSDHTARVWNAQDGRLLATLQGHTRQVTSAAFSPDGQRVVTASLDNTAQVWSAQDGRLLATLQGHTDSVTSAAFSPDGQRVVTASLDNTARVWSAQDGRLLATFQGQTSVVTSAAFSPDGQRVVTASGDNTARVWSAQDGRLIATLQGHTDGVATVAFSPDGQRVVTASRDNTARVWSAHDGRLLATLQGHTARVTAASFSPDGTRVVTASNDGTARIWNLDPAVARSVGCMLVRNSLVWNDPTRATALHAACEGVP